MELGSAFKSKCTAIHFLGRRRETPKKLEQEGVGNLRSDFPIAQSETGVTTTKKLFYEDLEANCLLCESSNCGFFLYSAIAVASLSLSF